MAPPATVDEPTQGQRRPRGWRSRTFKFTREGKYFVGLTFGVGLGAVASGNNLLYLLLGMLLSLIIASGILSEISLNRMEVTRRAPLRLHVGRPFLMGIGLKNHKRRLPSFSIEVEDFVAGAVLEKKCYFLKLPAMRLQNTSYRHILTRRGRYTFTGLRLSTKFPFGLFRKSRLFEQVTEVIVYPALHSVGHLAARSLALGTHGRGALRRSGEFAGLRDFREGDDPRAIHWRSSARRGRSLVREHEDETTERVTLFLDNSLPGGADSTDQAAGDGLERAVSLAASLGAHYLERGYQVRVVTRSETIGWLKGPGELGGLLRALALLPTVAETQPFCAAPDHAVDPILITRLGAEHPLFARVLEA